jgi:hypothetical protein
MVEWLRRVFGKTPPKEPQVPRGNCACNLLEYAKWCARYQPKGPEWYWWFERELNEAVADMGNHNGHVFYRDEAFAYIKEINNV